MPRDRGGIGRTGKKQKKARTLGSSQTSLQVVEAAAGAVAEPCSAAETAEQASLTAMNDDAGCAGQKRVRFEPDPPRVTGVRRTLPVSGPWTWTGRLSYRGIIPVCWCLVQMITLGSFSICWCLRHWNK